MNRAGQTAKKRYTEPVLVVKGNIEKLTLWDPCDKNYGGSDGFTFQSVPIHCVGGGIS